MKVIPIESGQLKLDGGAMFGVVPKKMWGKLNPPDEDNLCTWSMRCLLIDSGERRILVDTGVGNKQDAKFRSHFAPTGQEHFLAELAKAGYAPDDITDVLLTHLHFDHVGGAIRLDAAGAPEPVFSKATFWSNPLHWQSALAPNAREVASFLPENFKPLLDWGMLEMIDPTDQDVNWLPGIQLRFVYGHTEAMMLPIITTAEETFVYCADLIPSSHHVGLPYVMAYDLRPLDTMREKERLLREAAEGGYTLIFEHDPVRVMGKVIVNERGRIELVE
jgi:glyoxylase-like metal-dependent hydrolase (beta-lactamase superfamily II)